MKWMECFSDNNKKKDRSKQIFGTNSTNMALSYMQEAQQQFTAGLLANHLANRQDDSNRHQQASPPLSNVNQSAAAAAAAASLFPSNAAAAAAASLSMLTPQQILMSHALMAASLPGFNAATLAASTPSLYGYHQSLFNQWAPPSASSPTSAPSPPLPMQSGPVSPALSSQSACNNNNVVSSSVDRKKLQQSQTIVGKKRPLKMMKTENGAITTLEATTTKSVSPEPQHVTVKEERRDKVFTCKICSRSFGYKHVLQNHERTHTGEKPFQCPECHKRFTRDHHLKTHMRLHTGEKPYHCSHCDRQFVQVANLRRHLRVHTGERPYACEHCAAKFSDSNQLKAHVLIHSNEKPFKCEYCQQRFRRRHHMLSHKCHLNPSNSPSTTVPTPPTTTGITITNGNNIMTTQLGTNSHSSGNSSQAGSPAYVTDEDDIADDIADDSLLNNAYKQPQIKKQLIPSILNEMPRTLVNLPEQTEPEDLSVRGSNNSYRPSSHSSASPISDIAQDEADYEDNMTNDTTDSKDFFSASPNSSLTR